MQAATCVIKVNFVRFHRIGRDLVELLFGQFLACMLCELLL
jgi:hypothetical protein